MYHIVTDMLFLGSKCLFVFVILQITILNTIEKCTLVSVQQRVNAFCLCDCYVSFYVRVCVCIRTCTQRISHLSISIFLDTKKHCQMKSKSFIGIKFLDFYCWCWVYFITNFYSSKMVWNSGFFFKPFNLPFLLCKIFCSLPKILSSRFMPQLLSIL